MSQKQKNEYSSEPLWYVVHTYSGYENKVKTDLEKTLQNRDLQDYIFKIVIPMEEQIEIKKGKTKKNLRKVFPGYVLIKMKKHCILLEIQQELQGLLEQVQNQFHLQ